MYFGIWTAPDDVVQYKAPCNWSDVMCQSVGALAAIISFDEASEAVLK